MGKWAIIATGASLTVKDVARVRAARKSGKLTGVIAVSNAGIDMAPWADMLVSHDRKWWVAYPAAGLFKGRKFCASGCEGTEEYRSDMGSINSGLMAMCVARDIGRANGIILLGFDMGGTHYFGPHVATAGCIRLKNTDTAGFRAHIRQFDHWSGPPVVNATPGSALKCFPMMDLREAIG